MLRQRGYFLFACRVRHSPQLSTRQYARIVESWVSETSTVIIILYINYLGKK